MWDPYLQKDIDKLQRIQNRATRFVKQDYKSREKGSMTRMQQELGLPSLQDRRRQLRLVLMFKVVSGLVPGLPPDDFFTSERPKRRIRTRQFEDCISQNALEKYAMNNDRCYKIKHTNTDQLGNSFFHRTAVDWNHLPNEVVQAPSAECFQQRLSKD